MEESKQQIMRPKTINMPALFMSANWSDEEQMYKLFVAGLEQGVRGFDTAREYRVEKKVGRALKRALEYTGIRREDVWIQSRISNEEIINGDIRREIELSLTNMGLDYFDCFMFHWPTPDYFIPSWSKMCEARSTENTIRFLGLCNSRLRHLKQMEDSKVNLPDIIQVEVTPFWQICDLYEYCEKFGIKIQAFSPLCKMIEPIRNNHILQNIAAKHNVTIPQVILRWHNQRDISPISTSTKVERVKENFNIFSFNLDNDDMTNMSSLDCGYKYHLESTTCYGF